MGVETDPSTGGATEATLSQIEANTGALLTDAELRATPVPVSGSVATGGLTDTELRASPVAVSGPVTDAELRASPVPVSDGGGSLSVDGPLTDAELRATAVPVSGPLTDTELRATPVPVSGDVGLTSDSADLDTGAGTDEHEVIAIGLPSAGGHVVGGTAADPLRVDPTGSTTQPVSGPLTDTELRASAVPVSQASQPLPTGAATEATLATLATETKLEAVRVLLASLDGKDFATQTTLATLATETKLEAVRVLLASIDGKDFATQTTLATRATAAAQTDGSQVAKAVGDVAHDATDSGAPVKIGGKATAALPTAVGEGDRVDTSFDLQGRLRTIAQTIPAANSNVSSVAKSASSVTLLAANTDRRGATITNDSNRDLYLKLGATASTTSFTALLPTDAYYEVPFGYTGVIDGIWATGGSGSARITEITE